MEKKRPCKDCGQDIEWIRWRPRCFNCWEIFKSKRVAGFKLEKDE